MIFRIQITSHGDSGYTWTVFLPSRVVERGHAETVWGARRQAKRAARRHAHPRSLAALLTAFREAMVQWADERRHFEYEVRD